MLNKKLEQIAYRTDKGIEQIKDMVDTTIGSIKQRNMVTKTDNEGNERTLFTPKGDDIFLFEFLEGVSDKLDIVNEGKEKLKSYTVELEDVVEDTITSLSNSIDADKKELKRIKDKIEELSNIENSKLNSIHYIELGMLQGKREILERNISDNCIILSDLDI